MAQIGSFALLLALALSVYSFGAGLLALSFQDNSDWQWMGETARRAGVAVFGAVFLGEPRTEAGRVTGDVPAPMLTAMAVLAAFCIALGVGSPSILPFLMQPALLLAGPAAGEAALSVGSLSVTVTIVLCVLALAVIAAVSWLRPFDTRGRPRP